MQLVLILGFVPQMVPPEPLLPPWLLLRGVVVSMQHFAPHSPARLGVNPASQRVCTYPLTPPLTLTTLAATPLTGLVIQLQLSTGRAPQGHQPFSTLTRSFAARQTAARIQSRSHPVQPLHEHACAVNPQEAAQPQRRLQLHLQLHTLPSAVQTAPIGGEATPGRATVKDTLHPGRPGCPIPLSGHFTPDTVSLKVEPFRRLFSAHYRCVWLSASRQHIVVATVVT